MRRLDCTLARVSAMSSSRRRADRGELVVRRLRIQRATIVSVASGWNWVPASARAATPAAHRVARRARSRPAGSVTTSSCHCIHGPAAIPGTSLSTRTSRSPPRAPVPAAEGVGHDLAPKQMPARDAPLASHRDEGASAAPSRRRAASTRSIRCRAAAPGRRRRGRPLAGASRWHSLNA